MRRHTSLAYTGWAARLHAGQPIGRSGKAQASAILCARLACPGGRTWASLPVVWLCLALGMVGAGVSL